MNEMDERTRIAVTLDVDAARRLGPAVSDEAILAGLHKVRYETPSAPRELRHASGLWLRERGFHRMTGDPLLSEGELP